MSISPKHLLGVFLIAVSVLTLPQAIRQVLPLPITMDFPCFGDEDVRQEGMDSGTRIAYCLSYWPLNVEGGGIFAVGTNDQDEARVGGLRFRRDGETLYVNNRRVDPGGLYESMRWSTPRNPWLIPRNRFEIRNEGLISADRFAPPQVLFISGDVHEGWLPNPLGLIMILAGLVMVLPRRDLSGS